MNLLLRLNQCNICHMCSDYSPVLFLPWEITTTMNLAFIPHMLTFRFVLHMYVHKQYTRAGEVA